MFELRRLHYLAIFLAFDQPFIAIHRLGRVVDEILRRGRPELAHVRSVHGREGPMEMLITVECGAGDSVTCLGQRDLQPAMTYDARLLDQFDRLGQRAGVVLVREWSEDQ